MIVEIAMAVMLTGGISTCETSTSGDSQNQAASTPNRPVMIVPDNETAAYRERKDYFMDVNMNVGCPYQQFASYLATCKPEKRQQAWKRIVRENWLFFDKNRMKQFEAISRKHAFL